MALRAQKMYFANFADETQNIKTLSVNGDLCVQMKKFFEAFSLSAFFVL